MNGQKLVIGIVVSMIIGIAIGIPIGIIVSPKPSAQPTPEQPSTFTLTIYTMTSTNQPVVGAMVSIGGNQIMTGNDGSYSLTLQRGTYNWLATKQGYSDKSGSLILSSNYTLTITMTALPAPKSWHLIATFSGAEDKTTDIFVIQGSKFRINYTVVHENIYGGFYFFVYPEGMTVGSVASGDLDYPNTSESTICYEGAGNYYFKVLAANLVSWTITVEDYY